MHDVFSACSLSGGISCILSFLSCLATVLCNTFSPSLQHETFELSSVALSGFVKSLGLLFLKCGPNGSIVNNVFTFQPIKIPLPIPLQCELATQNNKKMAKQRKEIKGNSRKQRREKEKREGGEGETDRNAREKDLGTGDIGDTKIGRLNEMEGGDS